MTGSLIVHDCASPVEVWHRRGYRAAMQPWAFTRSIASPVSAVIFALGLFSVMDGLIKYVARDTGAVAATFWRSLIAAVVLTALALVQRRTWPTGALFRLHLIRGLVTSAMTVLFFWGLVRTPLAEAIALSFLAPLVTLALAAWLLGERIGRAAIAGSVASIAGVVVIALGQPASGEGRSLAGLMAILASAALYGWNLVLQRRQALDAAPIEIALFQMLVPAAVLAGPALLVGTLPEENHWLALAAASLFAVAAVMLFAWAYARAEAQAMAPLEYSGLLWAIAVGWLMFREVPSLATLAGCGLIIAGCLYAIGGQKRAQAPAGIIPPG